MKRWDVVTGRERMLGETEGSREVAEAWFRARVDAGEYPADARLVPVSDDVDLFAECLACGVRIWSTSVGIECGGPGEGACACRIHGWYVGRRVTFARDVLRRVPGTPPRARIVAEKGETGVIVDARGNDALAVRLDAYPQSEVEWTGYEELEDATKDIEVTT